MGGAFGARVVLEADQEQGQSKLPLEGSCEDVIQEAGVLGSSGQEVRGRPVRGERMEGRVI
jgi:hypothetical protein